jgi:murein DD-endopeptidase MepM/ murein hydrolase activator NlpD
MTAPLQPTVVFGPLPAAAAAPAAGGPAQATTPAQAVGPAEAVAVSFQAFVGAADPRDDKKRVDDALAKAGALVETASAEAQAAIMKLAEYNQLVPQARERAAKSRGLVAAAQAQIAVTRRAAAAAAVTATAKAEEHVAAAESVTTGRERLGRFVTATHQGANIVQLSSLLSSGGPKDLLTRAGYAQHIATIKKGSIDQLRQAERSAKATSSTAELASRAAAEAEQAAAAALAEAAAAAEAAERSERELTELARSQESAVVAAEVYRADVVARHDEVKRESDRIAAELIAWEQAQAPQAPQNSNPVLRPGARLLMPVKGWKSSDYGNRYDPYYNVWQLHAGVDIAAGGGEPIYAAADGQVASAGWRGGYGNYTCLGHGQMNGDSLSTCYAHQSRILVSEGQWVTRGQLIGRVGTTGASTGDHLHFEVRLNGYPTNPEEWLPGCLC